VRERDGTRWPALLLGGVLLLAGCAGPNGAAPVPAGNQTASLLRLGDRMRASGDMAGALGFYSAAAQRDPRSAPALEKLGEGFLAVGEPARAEQAFRAALAVRESGTARHGLAVALIGQQRAAEALPMLERLARGSSDPRLLRDWGVALDLAGQPRAAQEAYRRGLAAAPADATLHGNLALSLALDGQAEAAMASLRAALAAPVPDARLGANAVLVLALCGNEAEARAQGMARLGAEATEGLLARAATARGMPDAASRAAAIGLVMGEPRPAAEAGAPEAGAAAPEAGRRAERPAAGPAGGSPPLPAA